MATRNHLSAIEQSTQECVNVMLYQLFNIEVAFKYLCHIHYSVHRTKTARRLTYLVVVWHAPGP